MNSIAQRVLTICLVVTCLEVVAVDRPPATAKSCEDRGTSAVTPEDGAVFNDPTGPAAGRYRIISAIENNIAGTPAGEVIRIATLELDIALIVRALVRAHACGVGVRVLVPGRAWNDPAVRRLRRALGTDVSLDSWVTSCDGACTTPGSKGIMHVKLHLFSRVVAGDDVTDDVTMYSSSNLVRNQATHRYNDAYQVVGEPDVHASARRYFNKLKADKPTAYPRLARSPGFRQYFFPARADFHRGVFDRTRCRSGEGPATVDFAVSIWKRLDVVEELVELRRAGCTVRVLVALDKADRAVLRRLHQRGVPTHVQSMENGERAIHSKYIAIRGAHRGDTVSTVYCGSLNVSEFSARAANNVMLRVVDDRDAYRDYHQHFMGLWRRSRPLRASDVSEASRVAAGAAEKRS